MEMRRFIMKNATVAGLLALAIGGASPSLAQQPPSEDVAKQERWRPGPADLKAFTDARVAALKAGLALTPGQEKNWPPVEQAIREMAQARQARMAEWREHVKTGDAIAKLRFRADSLEQRAAELKKLADAAEPLYRTLTDDQKQRLRVLVRATMRHGHRYAGWRHRG